MNTKFSCIRFPFFGLKTKPYRIHYDTKNSQIKVTKVKNGKIYVLDGFNLNDNTYPERLLNLDKMHPQSRIVFDFTFSRLSQLIKSIDKVKWGVDSEGSHINLSKKEKFKAKIARVEKKTDQLLWLEKVSYPFELPHPVKNFKSKDLYALLVSVDNTWYIKDFTHEKDYITEVNL
jgi:hypothetical protein